jgi:prevent-host-death family protein
MIMPTKTISSSDARKKFSDLLNESGFGKERKVITRKGKGVAAVVPLEDLQTIETLEDEIDVRESKRILNDPETEWLDWEDVKKICALNEVANSG